MLVVVVVWGQQRKRPKNFRTAAAEVQPDPNTPTSQTMPNDSKRKHDDQEAEVQVDVEAIVDGAEQKKGGGSATLFVSNLPYSGQSSFHTKLLDLARILGGAAIWLASVRRAVFWSTILTA